MIKLLFLILIANPGLKPREHIQEIPRTKAHWVMDKQGHAVKCYGPTIILGTFDNGFHAYATKCEGNHGSLVELHD
jgi:hypothetical protein